MKLALCVVLLVALGDAAVYHPRGAEANRGQLGREISNEHERKESNEPLANSQNNEHASDIEAEVEKKKEGKESLAKDTNIVDHKLDGIKEALERDDREHVRRTRSKHSHGQGNYHYSHEHRHSSESSDSSDSSESSESHEHYNHGQGRYYNRGYQQGYGGWQGGYNGGYHGRNHR